MLYHVCDLESLIHKYESQTLGQHVAPAVAAAHNAWEWHWHGVAVSQVLYQQHCHAVSCCRNLLDSYYLGRVIGAGSFGVVREGIKVATGKRFAVKTVSKVPKRGAPTPRCVHLRLDCQRRGVSFVRGVREVLEQKVSSASSTVVVGETGMGARYSCVQVAPTVAAQCLLLHQWLTAPDKKPGIVSTVAYLPSRLHDSLCCLPTIAACCLQVPPEVACRGGGDAAAGLVVECGAPA